MEFLKKTLFLSAVNVSLALVISFSLNNDVYAADSKSTMIDDFSHASETNLSQSRLAMTDVTAGGKTQVDLVVKDGVMHLSGDIVPPRGQPGWSSLILPLSPMGSAMDASQYQGIRVMVKASQGNLSLSANSSDVTNFDYHSAVIVVKTDGEFHEVKIPFDSMKRMWSEQTKLNTKTLNSLSVVAFGMQKGSFDFELDEVSFY